MNWILLLYNSLLAVVVLDAVASIVAAAYLYSVRQRLGFYFAIALTGVAAQAAVAALTMGFSPAPRQIVVWIVVVRILTQLFKTATMVLLPLYLLGYVNGKWAPKRNAN